MMKIVIPCDFTDVVDYALGHAQRLARVRGEAEYTLLHIVEPNAQARAGEAQKMLDAYVEKKRIALGIDVKGVIKEGTLGIAIPEYAEERRADIIVMGTHGISGMQKFFGSKAVKVITGANVPFLAVQGPAPTDAPFRQMLMPVGPNAVEAEKLQWALRIAGLYKLEVHALAANYADNTLNTKVANKLTLLKQAFANTEVPLTIHYATKGANIKTEMELKAKEVGAEIFLIMVTQALNMIAPFIDTTDQNIIANSLNIPVVCLNPSMVL